jgi:mycothiol synthase
MLATPCITTRFFQSDDDFWRIRDLLIETYPITPIDFNWEIRRWDGQRFHRANAALPAPWKETIQLWETEDGRLVGVAHSDSESKGDVQLQIHPDYRYLVEEDMIAWAEDYLAIPAEDGQRRQLDIFAFEYDAARRHLLEQRGYEKMPYGGVTWRMRLGSWPLPPVMMAEGYVLRTTRPDEADYQRVADILNAAFNRDFHNAREVGNFMTLAPSFRHDLDLAAEAPGGAFAAYVGVIYDQANRRGLFEPVCTHPAHQRKGLARALMFEGMHRLKALGAEVVTVATGDMIPANRLYESVGFAEAYQGYIWRKVF